ncbi:hypothetical protein Air01nite_21030 [Asanoa iriomotensis]|uniref:Uncharacterized protein n=1 Tax=Asanoa iriomotensis TaxID=234613 RepID=A0ABQ4BZP9_9ACTN|nr:hypothetical protein Air01nite_21030 [Asanoa iriomotensis]
MLRPGTRRRRIAVVADTSDAVAVVPHTRAAGRVCRDRPGGQPAPHRAGPRHGDPVAVAPHTRAAGGGALYLDEITPDRRAASQPACRNELVDVAGGRVAVC